MSVPPDQMPPTTPPPDSVPPGPPPASPPPVYNAVPPPTSGYSAEERQWAMFAHLSALIGGLVTSAMGGGWGCFIGPLIIWLVKKDTMPFVNDQGKEALNFNITIALAALFLLILSIFTFGIGLIIAIPLWIIIAIYWLVFTIIAAIKANEGVVYRYPLCLRLIK